MVQDHQDNWEGITHPELILPRRRPSFAQGSEYQRLVLTFGIELWDSQGLVIAQVANTSVVHSVHGFKGLVAV